ncbi:hypothetical protein [Nonomuraea sp. NPDC049607]|uniref:hypothetical protein n=1 Tax=Nonomuraea sp. NPDC049607 TaxID=3154732 RepID=UPI0034183848
MGRSGPGRRGDQVAFLDGAVGAVAGRQDEDLVDAVECGVEGVGPVEVAGGDSTPVGNVALAGSRVMARTRTFRSASRARRNRDRAGPIDAIAMEHRAGVDARAQQPDQREQDHAREGMVAPAGAVTAGAEEREVTKILAIREANSGGACERTEEHRP